MAHLAKKRVLVIPGDLIYSPKRGQELMSKFDVTVLQEMIDKPKLIEIVKDYHAILSRSHLKIDKDVLDTAKNLQVIARQGAGYDEVDANYAAKKGIVVTNTPDVVANATADIAISHLLNITRHFSHSERWLRNGIWNEFLGKDPEGKVLGILGMGGIGKQVAKRALAFDMKILYHNRNRLPESEERKYGNAKYVTKDQLLAQSDYITVHVFASPATKHILNTEDFAKMKTGVYIINTSRGININEQALVDALKSGKVAGAGLDVFEKEPYIHPDLKQFPNVSLTSHIGTATTETRKIMEDLAIANVEAILEGKNPVTPVPECSGVKKAKL